MLIQSDRYLDQLETWHKLVTKEKEQYKTFADAIQVFLPVVRIVHIPFAKLYPVSTRLD